MRSILSRGRHSEIRTARNWPVLAAYMWTRPDGHLCCRWRSGRHRRSHHNGTEAAMQYLVARDDLGRYEFGSAGSFATLFHGGQHGLATISLMLGEVQPGEGAALH